MYSISAQTKYYLSQCKPLALSIAVAGTGGNTSLTEEDLILNSFKYDHASTASENIEMGSAETAMVKFTIDNNARTFDSFVFEGAVLTINVATKVPAPYNAYDAKDIINLLSNGNFVNTTGWTPGGSTDTAANNTMTNRGNGTTPYPYFYQSETFISGHRYYIKAKMRVTNAVCTGLGIQFQSTVVATKANPVENVWYPTSAVVTAASQTSVAFVHGYASSAIANLKEMEVQYVILVDLTAEFGAGLEPTLAEFEGYMSYFENNWFNGTAANIYEAIPLGLFIVDEQPKKLATIEIVAMDYMAKFNKKYNDPALGTPRAFPATLDQIVTDACTKCGVTKGTFTLSKGSYSVAEEPQDTTYHEVLAAVAELNGMFATINRSAEFIMRWYTDAGAEVLQADRFTGYSMAESNVTVTGVLVEDGDASHLGGTAGYVLNVTDNILLAEDDIETFADDLSTLRSGFTYRPYRAKIKNYIHFDVGDILNPYIDSEGATKASIITNISHGLNGAMEIEAVGEPAVIKGYASASPFTQNQKKVIDSLALEQANEAITPYAQELILLNERAANSFGLYHTAIQQPDESYIYYWHDAATLATSSFISMFTETGYYWTNNGWNGGSPTWNFGFTSNGDAVFRYLSVEGLSADWITAGKISSPSGDSYFDLDNDEILMTATIGGRTASVYLNPTEGLSFYDGATYRGGLAVKDGLVSLLTDVIGSTDTEACFAKFSSIPNYANSGNPMSQFLLYAGRDTATTQFLTISGFWLPDYPYAGTDFLSAYIYAQQKDSSDSVNFYTGIQCVDDQVNPLSKTETRYESATGSALVKMEHLVYQGGSGRECRVELTAFDTWSQLTLYATDKGMVIYTGDTADYIKVMMNFMPHNSGFLDLGTSTFRWKDGYFAGILQAAGLSTSWGVTSGVSTGALNAVMGTAGGATWLLSGTSNGTFRYGIQGLDSGGNLRLYLGTNYYQFTGTALYVNTTAVSLDGHTHSYIPTGGYDTYAVTSYGSTGLYKGNGDNASEATCNLDIQSWYGIGIKGMAGNPYGDGTRTIWINARNGRIDSKGGYYKGGTQASYEGHAHGAGTISVNRADYTGAISANSRVNFEGPTTVCFSPMCEGGQFVQLTAAQAASGYNSRQGYYNPTGNNYTYVFSYTYIN